MQPSALEARGYTLPTPMPCTSKYPESRVHEGLPCSASPSMTLSAAPGPAGREGLHGLKCPRALAPGTRQLLPASTSKPWPQCRGCVTPRTSRTENQTLRSQYLIRVGLAKSSFSALASPKLAGKAWQTNSFQGSSSGCALLARLCRILWDGCTQLCQSAPTSELTGAERQMTCYTLSYF